MNNDVQQSIDSAKNAGKSIYFLGCGGIGLSALMQYFADQGFTVAGSDQSSSPVTDMLVGKGLSVYTNQSPEHISDGIGCVFMSAAVHEDNPELMRIRELGIPTFFYSAGLGYISQNKKTIAVAGTHGKTSTTAMIARVLMDAGLSPTVIVGSLLSAGGSNYVPGNGEWFVVEACEYHRSFHDIHPTISVITNIDNDHLDYYGTMDALTESFRQFAASATDCVVVHSELPYIQNTVQGLTAIDGSDYQLNVDLAVPGNHMRANAQLALAVADRLGIDNTAAQKSLSEFSGTWRRSEYLGTTESGALIYDDYGHHPTEISVTLSGFRDRFADRTMTIIFQPHLYSRTKLLFNEFVDSLAIADRVYIAPIYAAREDNPGDISSDMLVDSLRARGIDAHIYNWDIAQLPQLTDRDLVITLGAGETYREAHKLLTP